MDCMCPVSWHKTLFASIETSAQTFLAEKNYDIITVVYLSGVRA